MNLKFYNYTCENTVVDKSDFLNEVTSTTGTMRNELNILEPIIRIDIRFLNLNLNQINYAYIEELDRYYFINRYNYYNNSLVDLYLKIDVLHTYNSSIYNLKGFIGRNSVIYNPMIKDEIKPYEYSKEYDFDTIRPTIFNDFNNRLITYGTYCILITIVGDLSFKFSNIEEGAYVGLPSIKYPTEPTHTGENVYVANMDGLNELAAIVMQNENYNTFIKNIIALPFEIPTNLRDSLGKNLYIGKELVLTENMFYLFTGLSSCRYKYASYFIPAITSYEDLEPYTNMKLYSPYVGEIDIDINSNNGCNLYLIYNIDFNNGKSNFYIYNKEHNEIIYSNECNLGVKIVLNTSNNSELTKQKENSNLNFAITSLSALAGIGVGIFTGNPLTTIINTSIGLSGLVKHLNTMNTLIPSAKLGISSGSIGLQFPQKTYIKIIKNITTISNENDYKKIYGLPCNDIHLLEDLRDTGITYINDVHIKGEGFIKCTYNERNEILMLLKNGVIL